MIESDVWAAECGLDRWIWGRGSMSVYDDRPRMLSPLMVIRFKRCKAPQPQLDHVVADAAGFVAAASLVGQPVAGGVGGECGSGDARRVEHASQGKYWGDQALVR